MRLRLTLEYDGTGFRGWAAQPGLRTVEGVLREALGAALPGVVGARDRRPHRYRRPRARPGRLASRSRAGRRRSARPTHSTPGCPTTSRVASRPRRRPTSTRAIRRVRAATATGSTAARAPLAVRDTAAAGGTPPARRGGARRVGRPTARRARLPRLHADRDAAPGLRPGRRVVRLAPARRDAGAEITAEHRSSATWCARWSARCWSAPGGARRAARGPPRAARPARLPRRGASTSSRFGY